MKNWGYSLLFIPLYMALFLFWRIAPSRLAFVAGSLVVASLMIWLIRGARKRNYFTGRVDLFLHAYVVIDVLLEGFVFELLLVGDRIGFLSSAEAAQLHGMVRSFHDNYHFLGCTAFFVVLIGLNRWYGLWRRRAPATTAEAPAATG